MECWAAVLFGARFANNYIQLSVWSHLVDGWRFNGGPTNAWACLSATSQRVHTDNKYHICFGWEGRIDLAVRFQSRRLPGLHAERSFHR